MNACVHGVCWRHYLDLTSITRIRLAPQASSLRGAVLSYSVPPHLFPQDPFLSFDGRSINSIRRIGGPMASRSLRLGLSEARHRLRQIELIKPDRAGPRPKALLVQHRNPAERVEKRRQRQPHMRQPIAALEGTHRPSAPTVHGDCR